MSVAVVLSIPASLTVQIGLVLLGAILVVGLGSPIVASVLQPYAKRLKDDDEVTTGGQIIGIAERLLIYVFVLVDAPSGIGFLITAKSIYSFGGSSDKQAQRRAKYVIIGTLVSFAYAVTLSYLVHWILRLLA